MDDLPLLPGVVARLLALSPNDEDYFEQVLALSQEAPPFALRLIKLANSAAIAPTNPVTSLQKAIVRVGAHHIAGLITSMAVMRVFMPSTQGERNLWIHGIEVAVASRVIAHTVSSLKVDMADTFSMLMLFNSDSHSWEQKILEQKIDESCIHPSWPEPPISAHELQNQASGILEESKTIISGLGIRSSE